MEVKQKILLTDPWNARATNEIKNDKIHINIYLPNFQFRKNTNIIKMASRLNYYFLLEYICALTSDGDMPLCKLENGTDCQCRKVLRNGNILRHRSFTF